MDRYAKYVTGTYLNRGNITGSGGVAFEGNSSRLANYGTIAATQYNGVNITDGVVLNFQGGEINAFFGNDGIVGNGVSTIVNYGLIFGNEAGILMGGGYVYNGVNALISASFYGILAGPGSSVLNLGVIDGGANLNGTGVSADVVDNRGTIRGGRHGVGAISVQNESGGSIQGDVGVNCHFLSNDGFIGGRYAGVDGSGSITNTSVIRADGYSAGHASGVGVNIYRSAVVTNFGSIYGSRTGVGFGYSGNDGVIINAGRIEGAAGFGVDFYYGYYDRSGRVYNQPGGTIIGAEGIRLGGGYILNQGGITSTNGTFAVDILASGTLDNAPGGTIQGSVRIAGTGHSYDSNGTLVPTTGTVSNYGTLVGSVLIGGAGAVTNSGGSMFGVSLNGGGSVLNGNGGTISGGGGNGVGVSGGAGNINNSATILSSATAVSLAAGGSVRNQATGTIVGGTNGVLVSGGDATVVDAGGIVGGVFAVRFTGGGHDKLVLQPGARFTGKVDGSGAVSTLELAGTAVVGTISGLGTAFAGFTSVLENARAKWVAKGANTLANTTALIVNGTLTGHRLPQDGRTHHAGRPAHHRRHRRGAVARQPDDAGGIHPRRVHERRGRGRRRGRRGQGSGHRRQRRRAEGRRHGAIRRVRPRRHRRVRRHAGARGQRRRRGFRADHPRRGAGSGGARSASACSGSSPAATRPPRSRRRPA